MAFDVRWRVQGAANLSGQVNNLTTTYYDLQNLDPGTDYEWSVREESGPWSTWTPFSTLAAGTLFNVEYRKVGSSNVTSIPGISSTFVDIQGLDPGTDYEWRVQEVGGYWSAWTPFTTDSVAIPVPAGTITFGVPAASPYSYSQPFTYDANDHTGFEYRIDGGPWQSGSSPVSSGTATAQTTYTIEVRAVNSSGPGQIALTTVTTLPMASVPAGTITLGLPTVTAYTFGLPFVYSGSDNPDFEYRVNGGAWKPAPNPLFEHGLIPDKVYNVSVRAYNQNGPGASASTSITTLAIQMPPSGAITFAPPITTDDSFSQPFRYSSTDATGFEYRVDGGPWTATGDPINELGLDELTTYVLDLRAMSPGGAGAIYTTTITTGASEVCPPTPGPGPSDGTYDFDMTVDEIIEDAYERIGLEARSGYDLRTARRSLNLLLTEWVNEDITLWTVERRTIPLLAGRGTYGLSTADVDVMEVALRTMGADTILTRTSWAESMGVPNKDQRGRPTQYLFDRQTPPQISLWPVPDRGGLEMVVSVFTYVQDVSLYDETVAAPRRFLPAMIAGLAMLLAEKRAPQRLAEKTQQYNAALNLAMSADEEVKSFTVRPSVSGRR